MKRQPLHELGCLLLLSSLLAAPASWADPMADVQLLRASGCGGELPAAPRLHHDAQLDRAAALWARGGPLAKAIEHSGYIEQKSVGLRLSGPDDSILQMLRRSHCRPVADQSLRDIGVYRSARESWLVIATHDPGATSPALSSAQFATRVLQLVNAARASGAHCGGKSFAPAPPLRLSATLDAAATEHAVDMARHDYFEHVDRNGKSPADRVRATGYREDLVGENIAYGPATGEEVVAGWLHSPGHCQNIMEPRFAEMGLAAAPGRGARRGLYWDQVLTQPAK